MTLISLNLSPLYLETIEKLIKEGRYKDRTDFIRASVRKLLKEEGSWPETVGE